MGEAVAIKELSVRYYQLGIICQVRTHDEPLVENSQVQSIKIVLNLSRQRHYYAGIPFNDFVETSL